LGCWYGDPETFKISSLKGGGIIGYIEKKIMTITIILTTIIIE
jgi:hypothetical protein